MKRYRLQEWLAFIGSEVHKAIGSFFNPKLTVEMREMTTKQLNGRFDYIDRQLQGRSFLMGAQFALADCYLYIVRTWTPVLNYDLTKYSNALAWQKRVASRDSVRQATGQT